MEKPRKLTCPECKEVTNEDEWIETGVECELCGSHSAIKCPKCEEYYFDLVTENVEELIEETNE